MVLYVMLSFSIYLCFFISAYVCLYIYQGEASGPESGKEVGSGKVNFYLLRIMSSGCQPRTLCFFLFHVIRASELH